MNKFLAHLAGILLHTPTLTYMIQPVRTKPLLVLLLDAQMHNFLKNIKWLREWLLAFTGPITTDITNSDTQDLLHQTMFMFASFLHDHSHHLIYHQPFCFKYHFASYLLMTFYHMFLSLYFFLFFQFRFISLIL